MLLSILSESGVGPADVCNTCEGKCCKSMPGIAVPDDFLELTVASVASLLASGDWSVDWYEGFYPYDDNVWRDTNGYYLRPATLDGRGDVMDASEGGQCVFLRSDGCSFPFDGRPHQCRHLHPSDDMHCKSERGKHWYATRWGPHRDLLLEAVRIVEGGVE